MKKKLLVSTIVVLLSLAVLLPTFADVGKEGNINKYDGEYRYMPQSMEPLVANSYGSQFALSTDSGEWTGAFDGHSDDDCVSVLHASSRWFGYCTASFPEVTVDGRNGGLELGIIVIKPTMSEPWTGEWLITGATGDLEGLEGEGTLWGHGYNPQEPEVPGVLYYKVKKLKGLDSDDD
jgi:hypothetical protein